MFLWNVQRPICDMIGHIKSTSKFLAYFEAWINFYLIYISFIVEEKDN